MAVYEKQQLRQKMRSINAELARLKACRSEDICENLLKLEQIANARVIMSYIALPSEPDMQSLHEALIRLGKTLCFPRCTSSGHMEAYAPYDSKAWEKGSFGLSEPVPARSDLIHPEDIDLIICPCIAFDDAGHRLGHGGGYYDRFVTRAVNAAVCCVAFELQRVPQIPSEATDISADILVTDLGVYETACRPVP